MFWALTRIPYSHDCQSNKVFIAPTVRISSLCYLAAEILSICCIHFSITSEVKVTIVQSLWSHAYWKWVHASNAFRFFTTVNGMKRLSSLVDLSYGVRNYWGSALIHPSSSSDPKSAKSLSLNIPWSISTCLVGPFKPKNFNPVLKVAYVSRLAAMVVVIRVVVVEVSMVGVSLVSRKLLGWKSYGHESTGPRRAWYIGYVIPVSRNYSSNLLPFPVHSSDRASDRTLYVGKLYGHESTGPRRAWYIGYVIPVSRNYSSNILPFPFHSSDRASDRTIYVGKYLDVLETLSPPYIDRLWLVFYWQSVHIQCCRHLQSIRLITSVRRFRREDMYKSAVPRTLWQTLH